MRTPTHFAGITSLQRNHPAAALFLACLLVLPAPPLCAQQDDSLTVRVERAIAEETLVGVAWSLVTPDGVRLGAAGVRDASLGTRLQPGDRMHVGSVAKTLVATGILALVTEGRFGLDTPVSELLPDVRIINPWSAQSPLVVRHLLDHTSGLDDVRLWQVFTLRGDPDAPLASGLGSRPEITVRHPPGARFSYSNTGYLLLGMVIERITGMRYEAWLDASLLAPLGMHRSTFAFTSQEGVNADPTLAMGHFGPTSPAAAFAIPVRPASQFTTTAGDMAIFARFLMSDGMADGRQLVDASLLRGMAAPTTTEAVQAGLAAGYALGLTQRERWGITGNCHLGNIGTFRAILCLYPEEQRAFFAAYNSDPEDGNFTRVDSLLATALGVQKTAATATAAPGVNPADWNGWYLTRPNRFEQLAYLDELFGVTRVAWNGETLELGLVQGTARILEPVGDALFRSTGRREATHVLSRASNGALIVSDGLRTYEQVPRLRVWAYWLSAGGGMLALMYLLFGGTAVTVRALLERTVRSEPLRWPTMVLWLMVPAPMLYLLQPFLAIGDPTPANLVVACLTGVLPFALLLALVQRLRSRRTGVRAALDVVALVAALQWCLVLAAWGLLPLALWR